MRAALRRFSPALVPDRPCPTAAPPPACDPSPPSALEASAGGRSVDLAGLTFADLGDVDEPDGAEGEARTRAAVRAALEHARLLVALGGDNSVTVATALGAWGTTSPPPVS